MQPESKMTRQNLSITLPSLGKLKQIYNDTNLFHCQTRVYAAIISYYSKNNMFAELEFKSDVTTNDFVINEWKGQFFPGSNWYGILWEGHKYWLQGQVPPPGTTIITGHDNFSQTNGVTFIGFDAWDAYTFDEFKDPAIYYEINRSSVTTAEYDLVVPVGYSKPHRDALLKELSQLRGDLTIVTDDRQQLINTSLRFSNMGIEVYFNKVSTEKFYVHAGYQHFYDPARHLHLDHMPHKKMHAIARVNVVLESTCANVVFPFLTEKTFKVLAQARPFVIVGDTGSIRKLQQKGFKTFGDYCDESYDTETDLLSKVQKVVTATKQLNESCKRYPDEIDAICKYNQDWFFNTQRHADELATFGGRILDLLKEQNKCISSTKY